jgi:hypothetical protein
MVLLGSVLIFCGLLLVAAQIQSAGKFLAVIALNLRRGEK